MQCSEALLPPKDNSFETYERLQNDRVQNVWYMCGTCSCARVLTETVLGKTGRRDLINSGYRARGLRGMKGGPPQTRDN